MLAFTRTVQSPHPDARSQRGVSRTRVVSVFFFSQVCYRQQMPYIQDKNQQWPSNCVYSQERLWIQNLILAFSSVPQSCSVVQKQWTTHQWFTPLHRMTCFLLMKNVLIVFLKKENSLRWNSSSKNSSFGAFGGLKNYYGIFKWGRNTS